MGVELGSTAVYNGLLPCGGVEMKSVKSSGGWDLDLTGTRDPLTMLHSVTAGTHLLMGIAGPEHNTSRRKRTSEMQGQYTEQRGGAGVFVVGRKRANQKFSVWVVT